MRVLVVEDDQATSAVLSAVMKRQAWEHRLASSLAAGWELLCEEPFDLLLLDLGLPDGDGTELLRRLRESPAGRLPDAGISVLIITSNAALSSRVTGLDLGADGYVVKPFHPDEVAALIRAVRRRTALGTAGPLRYRDLVVDRRARIVTRGGERVALSEPEFRVFLALLEARPRVLSRAEILGGRGGHDREGNAVEVHVHHLRRKLGESVIRTVRGLGYCVPPDAAGPTPAAAAMTRPS
jgi:two-component system response regulator QseB